MQLLRCKQNDELAVCYGTLPAKLPKPRHHDIELFTSCTVAFPACAAVANSVVFIPGIFTGNISPKTEYFPQKIGMNVRDVLYTVN